jgi:hypothetical protein
MTYGYYRGVGGYWVWSGKKPYTGKLVFRPGPKLNAGQSPGEGLQVIRDLEPYKNIIDGKVIGGRKQHRDFLRAHGCIEVGTEPHNKIKPREEKRDPHLRDQIKAEGRRRGFDWV